MKIHSNTHLLDTMESAEFNTKKLQQLELEKQKQQEDEEEEEKEEEIVIIPLDLDDDRIDYYLQSIEYFIYLVEGDQCVGRVISISGNNLNVLDEVTLDVVITYKISEFKSFRLISLPSSGINIGYKDDEIEFYVFIFHYYNLLFFYYFSIFIVF